MRVGELRCRQSENKSFHYTVSSPLGKMLLVTPALFPASHILGGWQSLRIKPRPSGLRHQCSATELQQPDNHQALTIYYTYCTGGSQCFSHMAGFLSAFFPCMVYKFCLLCRCVGVWVGGDLHHSLALKAKPVLRHCWLLSFCCGLHHGA